MLYIILNFEEYFVYLNFFFDEKKNLTIIERPMPASKESIVDLEKKEDDVVIVEDSFLQKYWFDIFAISVVIASICLFAYVVKDVE